MQGLTAVVLGATGLIGQQVVQELLKDDAFTKVVILVRKPVTDTHPKLEVRVVDFSNEADLKNKIGTGHCIFCCVGTTQKQVQGNRNAYRKVDYDIPVTSARIGVEHKFQRYLLVSAVGANPLSENFYLQLKGAVEEDVAAMPFLSIHIFRPSVLLGKRKTVRVGETLGGWFMKLVSPLLVGSLKKYRPIAAGVVAKAMVAAARETATGTFFYHYPEIVLLTRN